MEKEKAKKRGEPGDPRIAALTAAGLLMLFIASVLCMAAGYPAAGVVFFALTAAYLWAAKDALSTYAVDDSGISRWFLGRRTFLDWDSVREVGIMPNGAGRRDRRAVKPSRCRLYYSPRVLTDRERARACMSLPRDMIALTYTLPRMRTTLAHWPKKMILLGVTAKEMFGSGADAAELDMEEVRY